MTVHMTDAARNAVADGFDTAYGANPILRLYDGAVPANESTALGGATVLWQATMAPAPAAAGVKDVIGGTLTSTGTAAAGTGKLATFYRIYRADGTTVVEQGSVSITGGGGDMELDNPSIAEGQSVSVNAFTKDIPG